MDMKKSNIVKEGDRIESEKTLKNKEYFLSYSRTLIRKLRYETNYCR